MTWSSMRMPGTANPLTRVILTGRGGSNRSHHTRFQVGKSSAVAESLDPNHVLPAGPGRLEDLADVAEHHLGLLLEGRADHLEAHRIDGGPSRQKEQVSEPDGIRDHGAVGAHAGAWADCNVLAHRSRISRPGARRGADRSRRFPTP